MMMKILEIQVSDNIYKSLTKVALQAGQTPEQVILHWIERSVDQSTKDPLLALAGAFEAPTTNISEQHDLYIGLGLEDDHA